MKKWIYLIVLLLSLVQPVAAAQIPEELEKALPAEAEELLDTLDREAEVSDTLSQGLSVLWEQGTQLFLRAFRSRVGGPITVSTLLTTSTTSGIRKTVLRSFISRQVLKQNSYLQ